jgi:hypothetical protein
MGMYTQLHYGAQLNKDVPAEVVQILRYMLGEDGSVTPAVLPDHALFRTSRWVCMLRCDSYYFDYKTAHLLQFDEIANQFYFNVTSNLKNYDDEIKHFVNWIAPYIDKDAGDFLGYHRYETTETPTLLFYEKPASVGAVDPVGEKVTG